MPTSTAQPGFHEAEIRETLHSLVGILEDADFSKRAYAYTEDATFVMFGAAPVHGREEMLRRLETGTVLSSIKITPHTIEGDGRLAYVYGDFACMAGRTHTSPGTPTSLYFLMVLRKEADGAWRIAREILCPVAQPAMRATTPNRTVNRTRRYVPSFSSPIRRRAGYLGR